MLAAIATTLLCLLAVAPAASAQGGGKADIRFVHAVPGVGDATLSVGGQQVGAAGFGEYTDFTSVPAGSDKLVLEGPDGLTLRSSDTFKAGQSYTVLALAKGESAELRPYRDEAAKPGKTTVRMIHAAPEFGEPDINVDGQVIAESVSYRATTGYLDLKPGTYTVSLDDPQTGKPVLGPQDVPLSAGTASTAFVVGSRGEKPRFVLAQDSTALPSAAPETGFGGSLGGESPLALALLAAGLAAAAGSAGLAISRRRRPGDASGA